MAVIMLNDGMYDEHSDEDQNAVIYARYSSEGQREESIEGQIRECRSFAMHHKLRIIGEYIDRAKTATNDNRPDFQRMIRESRKGDFTIVLVWKMDRFSRKRADAINYRSILRTNGVKLISINDPNVEGPNGILVESLIDGMAESYSADLSLKARRGITENVMKGLHIGGSLLFGYKVVDHRLVIDEKEGPIVKEMFRLYVQEDMNCSAIAKKLTADGYTRNDGYAE